MPYHEFFGEYDLIRLSGETYEEDIKSLVTHLGFKYENIDLETDYYRRVMLLNECKCIRLWSMKDTGNGDVKEFMFSVQDVCCRVNCPKGCDKEE